MDRRKSAQRGVETRRRNSEARRERRRAETEEIKAQAAALRQIRDNPEAAPAERLKAIELLESMKKEVII